MQKGLGFLRRQFYSLEIFLMLLCIKMASADYYPEKSPSRIHTVTLCSENSIPSDRKEEGLARTPLFPYANPISFVSL